MVADKQDRSVSEIKADLAKTRARLASSISDLIDDVHPKNVKARAVDDAKKFVADEFSSVKSQVKNEDGWRVDRLIAIGGAIVGSVAFVLTLRAIVKGSKRKQLTWADKVKAKERQLEANLKDIAKS